MRIKLLLALAMLLLAVSAPAMAATEGDIRAKVDDFLDGKISKQEYLAWAQAVVSDESNDAKARGYAQTMIAVTLSEEGDLEEAYPAAQKAVAMRPDLPLGHQAVAKCLAHLGKFAEARESMQRAVELTQEGPAKENRKRFVALYAEREASSAGALAAPQADVTPQRTIDFNVLRFFHAYNEYATRLGVSALPTASTSRKESAYSMMLAYESGPHVAVQFIYPPKDGRNPTEIKFIGAGFGTPAVNNEILMSASAFAAAVTPTMEPNARGGLMKTLGLTGDFLDGKTREADAYGMRWTVEYKDLSAMQQGLTSLVITLSPPAQ